MSALLQKMKGDKKGWYKVSDLVAGAEIARPRADFDATPGALSSESGDIIWDEIVSITPVGREQVYDIEVEGTHNFVGNDIFAHNTYVLRANTMLAVTGEVNASEFTVPVPALPTGTASSTLFAEIPPEVLTADGTGVDLFKLATYNLAIEKLLEGKVEGQGMRITALEDRVTKLETGAVSSASGNVGIGSSTLASVFEGLSAYIGKGFAQFGSLIADRFVAAKNSAGTSSAGTVSMLTGNTVAQVTNAYVTPATKIFVTFNSQITGSWWVSDKTDGSFRVVLSVAQTTDVSFDYFLVQTEGQTATSTPDGTQDSNSNQNSQHQSSNSDTVAPVITLLGDNPMHLSVDGVFTEPGVTVLDNVDGTSDPIVTFVDGIQQEASATTITTVSAKTYTITYKATDAAGNTGTATRSVIVGTPGDTGGSEQQQQQQQAPADTTKPVVTLVGEAAMQIVEGQTFQDPGATAADDVDNDLTASIIVSVTDANNATVSIASLTATVGTYSITYSATDAAGNTGTAGRMVTVTAPAAAPAAATTTPGS